MIDAGKPRYRAHHLSTGGAVIDCTFSTTKIHMRNTTKLIISPQNLSNSPDFCDITEQSSIINIYMEGLYTSPEISTTRVIILFFLVGELPL